jgi:hypothetical protein
MCDVTLPEAPTDQQLILASERVVWQFRASGRSLAEAIERVFGGDSGALPMQTEATRALATVEWPLVLTTNYDRMFNNAFNENHHHAKHEDDSMAVVGRSVADCHTVLNSLASPVRPLLWALQGFLGNSLDGRDLRPEIVLGYEQYRRASFENTGFRTAFTEVYRHRSLLFVGAGLGEEYFRSLFGESIVRLGMNAHAHCVLLNEADLAGDTPWFLHTRMNIVVLTYQDAAGSPKYSGFVPCLQKIASFLNEPPRGSRRYWVGATPSPVAVDVEPTALPDSLEAGHWAVGSAGRRGSQLHISGDVPVALRGPIPGDSATATVLKVADKRVLLAIARTPNPGDPREPGLQSEARDLRNVAVITEQALRTAVAEGAHTVSFMLLSASTHQGRWARVFSLVEMLRGIRRYIESSAESGLLRIILHDTAAARQPDQQPNRSVWQAIESRRLDPRELLECKDLRFQVDIEIDGHPARTTMYLSEDKSVAQLAEYLQLPGTWAIEVSPNPAPKQGMRQLDPHLSLLNAGVVPGSTLTFRRHARF